MEIFLSIDNKSYQLMGQQALWLSDLVAWRLEDIEYDVMDGDSRSRKEEFAFLLWLHWIMKGFDWQHTSGPYTKEGMPIKNERFPNWQES